MNKKQRKKHLKHVKNAMKYHCYSKWTGIGVLNRVSKKHELDLVSEDELQEYFKNTKRR